MNPSTAIFAQADSGLFRFLHTLRGPDFLLLFWVWFLVTFCSVLLWRWRVADSPLVSLIGLLGFEALGVARMIDGSAHGLHKWGFLILMMVAGGIAFFIRAKHFKTGGGDGNCSGGSWWSSGCSSGSSGCGSSGGGGCGGGGGGCGGCGGS